MATGRGLLCAIAALSAVSAISAATRARAQDGPDLVLDVPRMQSSARIATAIYHAPTKRAPALDATVPVSGTCVLDPDENCVGGAGIRKLLRFDVLVHNRGNEDLVLGDPKQRPDLFEYSACHRHYHFRGAALYELLDESGQRVRLGRKQGFCLEDTIPSERGSTIPKKYTCTNQGIQVGWADFYPAILDCQWIDVTDLPPGNYKLHVAWNPNRLMTETRYDNDEGTVDVAIPAATDAPPVVDAVRAPTSSIRIHAGELLEVAWRAHDDEGVVTQEIWLSTDDGETWKELVGDVPGDRSRFSLRLPTDSATPNARIKVVARDASVQRGELTSPSFRILARDLRLPFITRSGGVP